MPLDLQVQQLLDSLAAADLPPLNELSPAEARQQMLDASLALGKSQAVQSVEDRTIPGPSGAIPVRIYKPAGDALPVVVYFHGGGWVIGSIQTHDRYCRALANSANAVIVSVEYRLAPEHKFPAAAEDAYEAARWVSENVRAIGGRPGAIAVAGDSAGGNLATVVALMSRDRGGPQIDFQVLIYPIADHDFETSSYRNFADGYFLTRDAMIWFWDQYCRPDTDRSHSYLSPLRDSDLNGLPAALVLTAEYDPLCDEGECYAEKLRQAGVDVTLSRYDGMIHGFVRRLNYLDVAQLALDEVASAIAGALH